MPWWISVRSGADGNGVRDREACARVFHPSQLTRRRRRARGEVPVAPLMSKAELTGRSSVLGSHQRQISLRRPVLDGHARKNRQTDQGCLCQTHRKQNRTMWQHPRYPRSACLLGPLSSSHPKHPKQPFCLLEEKRDNQLKISPLLSPKT